ncbi:uncharacterized protein EV154DRAFT_531630 [Mucor mucedo]|uniref:uncharacterized protein n=2 Tax=Mucor mucedo TaxID=29922 RepID=UPI002220E577|nr:uncharacterized protein EV154DRAFT_531630 [Mucor mucedo]KAI7867910.1 hypothetical protein EV154DRAFT_531630 [Mucor mucedo]
MSIPIPEYLSQVNERLSRLESAHDEIFQLKTALARSEASRRELEKQVSTLLALQKENSNSAPPPPTSQKPPSYANVAAAPPKTKKQVKKKTPLPSVRRATATVGRLFGPQANKPSEYQFLYYGTSVRRPLKELRRTLQATGVNVSRILDIQYPDSRVISFLLHTDFVVEFTSVMHNKGRGTVPLDDYDPLDPAKLKDPKFANLSLELRCQKAHEIQNLRCLRALSFVRRSARLSVARSFLHYERINQKQFDAILAEELEARSSLPKPTPNKTSSVEKLAAKNKQLSYLGFLLHHDHETAKLLSEPNPEDFVMPDIESV